MLKLPLLRSATVDIAPEQASDELRGVWLGCRHLAVWWRGDGSWPVVSFRCLGSEEDWYIVDHVRATPATRLLGRQRRPSGLPLRRVHSELLLPFRRWVAVNLWPQATEELCFDAESSVAVLEAQPFYEASRRVIQARGRRQAQGVFLTLVPGPDGSLVEDRGAGRQRPGRAAGGRAGRRRAGPGGGGSAPLAVVGRLPRRRLRGDPAAGRGLGGLVGRAGRRAGGPCLGRRQGDGGAAAPEPRYSTCYNNQRGA